MNLSYPKLLARPTPMRLDTPEPRMPPRLPGVTKQFQPANMRASAYQLDELAEPPVLCGDLVTQNLRFKDDQDTVTVAGVSLNFSLHERTAIVG